MFLKQCLHVWDTKNVAVQAPNLIDRGECHA